MPVHAAGSTFGLTGCAGRALPSGCTLGNGATVRKVAQNGGQRYPRADVGWAQEISLDLDMVSAICPACSILLVEAASNQFSDLGAAVDEAAALGATEISARVTAPSAGAGGYAAGLYAAAPSSLNDVVSGSNGSCGSLLCTARAGWDGPTGLGTPNGTGAF